MTELKDPTHLVGIGASAGGLEALQKFFQHFPSDTNMAFIVVQHLSPSYESFMGSLLASHTSMPIYTIEDEMPIQPNSLYLLPPARNMIVMRKRFVLSRLEPAGSPLYPINTFMRSLALDVGPLAVGVILSGSGDDGTQGMQAIHDAGGLVVVQSPPSARFSGMPQSVVANVHGAIQDEPEKLGARILAKLAGSSKDRSHRGPASLAQTHAPPEQQLAASANRNADRSGAKEQLLENPDSAEQPLSDTKELPPTQDQLQSIFELLWKKFEIDFSTYKASTILRRIQRRLELDRIKDIDEYVSALEKDETRLDLLYRDLLVEVTQFFRDPEAFELLNQRIKVLIDEAEPNSEIRAWVSGCATGEEAYSIAILLDGAIRANKKRLSAKIFATDVHRSSLDHAASGVYSSRAVESLGSKRLEQYFTEVEGHYQIRRHLRDMVVFSRHNVIEDVPFTRMDLVCCRNLLIYLLPEAQNKALTLMHFALRMDGLLFLGSSEQLGTLSDEFETLSSKWRIFRKRRNVRLGVLPLRSSGYTADRLHREASSATRDLLRQKEIYESLLDRHFPPGFLLDREYRVQRIFGDARHFVSLKRSPTLNILDLTTGDLNAALRAALHRTSREQEPVVYEGISTVDSSTSDTVVLRVSVERLTIKTQLSGAGQEELPTGFLVLLSHLAPPHANALAAPATQIGSEEISQEQLRALENELQHTRQYLQASNEELETTNEELQATNEELIAANEELQSSNEELQSVNEELYTVNAEFQQKIQELEQVATDMANLQRSTGLGVIFVDRELKIRYYSEAISEYFNLQPQDIGRPLDHLRHRLSMATDELLDLVQHVLLQEGNLEREVTDGSDEHFLLRLLPYLSQQNEIQGVVLTLLKIRKDKDKPSHEQDFLEQINRDLYRSNAELDSFVYIASHDLKEPLRGIYQYAQFLREDYLEQLEEEGQNMLSAMVDQCDRMMKQIDALRYYARIGRQKHSVSKVDLNYCLEEALAALQTLVEENQIDIRIPRPLPTVCCNEARVITIFQNLIANAIRYNDKDFRWVEIGWSQRAESSDEDETEPVSEVNIYVQDNGIGISPNNYERIFDMFRRLHGREEYGGGTGAGLALVRKIIEQDGGRIWVESEEGVGTRFSFTIGQALS